MGRTFRRCARGPRSALFALALLAALATSAGPGAPAPPARAATAPATGPLRVSTANPRYFADPSGRIVYLTGSHTWSNLQDNGHGFPPPAFDYPAYLDFLAANGHNFFRLWVWEQARWTVDTTDEQYWFDPMPFERSGPGLALDGRPKFDLSKFNQAYFDRMHARVIAAGERGMYVSIMLFDGWSVSKVKGTFGKRNPWQGHPFNAANNINGVDGDVDGDDSGPETHELGVPAARAVQEAYVRKVIDSIGDLDNVLYEISNESDGGSTAWQYHMIAVVKQHEARRPKQHPVGMTSPWPGGFNPHLFGSAADWISLNNDPGVYFDPPAADGSKVLLTDTDHLCGVCGDRAWVWRTFLRGHNPIFMDAYDGAGYGVGGEGFRFDDPAWVGARLNMGYTLRYANRMGLAGTLPRGDLASSGYCLARAVADGARYLVYLPEGGSVSVDLSAAQGALATEWLNPATGAVAAGAPTSGGANRSFTAPFAGDAVLYIYQPARPRQYVPLVTLGAR